MTVATTEAHGGGVAAAGLAIALALAGCATRVHTTVEAARPAGDDVTRRAPVAGARVAIFCPQLIKSGGAYPIGETDARGELSFREPALGRWIHDGCSVVIEKEGYRPLRVPVDDACVQRWATSCVRAVVTARLEPSSREAEPARP